MFTELVTVPAGFPPTMQMAEKLKVVAVPGGPMARPTTSVGKIRTMVAVCPGPNALRVVGVTPAGGKGPSWPPVKATVSTGALPVFAIVTVANTLLL